MAIAMDMATLLTERALIPGVGALQEGVQVATVTKYIAAASFVLVVYDWLLTFDQEVRLMWKAEWSLVKFLIFFVRYASIVGMFMHTYHLAGFRGPLSNSFCQVWTVIGGVMEILAIGASNWLLMLRLTSLYASQRMLVWFLYGYYILAYASSFVFLAFSLKEILRTMVYSPVIHLCVTTTKHPVMVGIFCAPFTFEMVVFIMTAYKAVQHAQMIPPSRRKETPFLFVLHRDGLTYHVLLTVVRIWNIYVYLCLPINYIWMAINILWSVVCTFTARIFLNLRGVAHPLNLYESETTSIPTIITQPHHLGHHHGSTSDILVSPTSPRTPKSPYSASGLLTPSSAWKSHSNVFTHSDLEMSNVTKSLDRVGHYTKAKNKPLVRQTTRESTRGKRSKEQSGTVRSLPNNRVHVEIEVRQVREDW